MARVNKSRSRLSSRTQRVTPHSSSTRFSKSSRDVHCKKGCIKVSEKTDWEEATCSVCMEFPHNAVLLLCSSHDKGCRPFMCATSYRYSNCLEQYKKAYTKVTSSQNASILQESSEDPNFTLGFGYPDVKTDVTELLCPLCRGQVKGWTVVEPARKYFNTKKRTCMQDNCSFLGTYKDIRKHVSAEHPWARPREVDPSLTEKWKKLENERELDDVFSTIRSTMPGAIVMGDYVIEGNYHGFSRDYDVDDYFGDAFLGLETYGQRWSGHMHSRSVYETDYHSLDEEDFDIPRASAGGASGRIYNYIGQSAQYNNRLLLRRSRRRRRRRTVNRAVNGGR